MPHNWDEHLRKRLSEWERQGLSRALKIASGNGTCFRLNGREVLSFASNDYLALSTHPHVIAAAKMALDEAGAGSTASPLIVGHRLLHENLEKALADFKRSEAALVFPSGFQAAVATLGALAGEDDTIILDRLAHASLIDGARLSGARVRTFKHNDTSDLEAILKTEQNRRCLVVVESLYSMDGDLAPLDDLYMLSRKYRTLLLVDEAHATGVLGNRSHGALDELYVFNIEAVDLEETKIEESAIRLVPYVFCVENHILPIALHDNVLTVAIWDPLNLNVIDDLRFLINMQVEPVLAKREAIDAAIQTYYAKSLPPLHRDNLRALPKGRRILPQHIIAMGTLSKALGSQGGFVCASRTIIDTIVHAGRAYLFSTALAPASAAAALAALKLIDSEPQHRAHLLELTQFVRGELKNLNVPVIESTSPIIAVIAGDERRATDWSAALLERSLYVPAIRYPTVKKGQARLRISLSAAHTRKDCQLLIDALSL